jgi:hypothetical protein
MKLTLKKFLTKVLICKKGNFPQKNIFILKLYKQKKSAISNGLPNNLTN